MVKFWCKITKKGFQKWKGEKKKKKKSPKFLYHDPVLIVANNIEKCLEFLIIIIIS
jgi:ribosome-binding ATPase YchF (GTP1/OBG family)